MLDGRYPDTGQRKMFQIALRHGVPAGLFITLTMIVGHHVTGSENANSGQVFGYLVMLVALSVVFVAVKRYRDEKLGGVIGFGRAFLIGICISAMAATVYVSVWEIYHASTDFSFYDNYIAAELADAETAGTSGAELEAMAAEFGEMRSRLNNPLFRIAIALLEIFPVGILVSLIAAAVLRDPRVLPAQTRR